MIAADAKRALIRAEVLGALAGVGCIADAERELFADYLVQQLHVNAEGRVVAPDSGDTAGALARELRARFEKRHEGVFFK